MQVARGARGGEGGISVCPCDVGAARWRERKDVTVRRGQEDAADAMTVVRSLLFTVTCKLPLAVYSLHSTHLEAFEHLGRADLHVA